MKILKKHELIKLTTPRLLTLYKKIIKQFHTSYHYMLKGVITKDNYDVKHCLELNTYCRKMKDILDTRENVE
jgi:hypothetical protein